MLFGAGDLNSVVIFPCIIVGTMWRGLDGPAGVCAV